MFTNPFPNAFGLDISDLSVKTVWLRNISHRRKSPSYELAVCRSAKLPHGLIVNGEIQEPELVRKYIKHLLAGKKGEQKAISGSWVVASLPETQSFIKKLTIQKQQDEIIEDEILSAAKKHIPFDEDSYYTDWQIVPNETVKQNFTNILVGAVPKTIANSYTYLLESMGMGVISLEIEALSIARAMITAPKNYSGEARALLDLGATRSSFIIYDHDSVQFSISIPFSGEMITTALSQKLGISYDDAEQRKIKCGLDSKEGKGKTFIIISTLTNQLADNVEKAIQFYYSHFPGANKITHITMCGGMANLKRLDKVLSLKLKINAKPGRPWKNLMSKKPIPVDIEESLSYATAIGLALRAADNPFFRHNII
ncbi:MAG: pilus assembly protein PilM [Patescibacteria group bacterium]